MESMNILRVDASMRRAGSRSRALTDTLIEQLRETHGSISLTQRDLSDGVPFIDAPWIDANFTAPCERSSEQRAVLARSDALLSELQVADVLVIGSPMYNFGIPAALKAWVDLVVRAKESFRYTDSGPEGLLKNKVAYIVLVSGGTKAGADIDFAWPYLRHILGFVGITDVRLIASDLIGIDRATADAQARSAISALGI
ncbi:MAG: NAD(P)H-dependent oxidoreductase [Pseudomonadota bacterium]